MNKKIEMLKRYLDVLTADTGWQVIIYDYYHLLYRFECMGDYLANKNWHTNPYCLAVKSNKGLLHRCVALKSATRESIRKRAKPGWTVSYCGVAEYSVPIFVSGMHIATIGVAGFVSPLSDRMSAILAKRTGMSTDEFAALRESSLRPVDESVELRLNGYLLPIAETLRDVLKGESLVKDIYNSKKLQETQIYVINAIDYIQKHYAEDVTPESVAKRYNLSRSYLEHLFLKYTNEGMATAIRRKRLEEACMLLKTTNRSVRNIALSCGFYNTDYFSIIFRRTFGVSPLAFRRSKDV